MAAVVVVTRNPALAMGLGRHGYDVSDVRPDSHGGWTRQARWADAVVLELSDALAAEAAVQRLRAEGLGVPVLLASNATPGWETTADHVGPGARVLPLPMSLPALVSALEELLAAGPVDVPPPPSNEEELLSAVAASIGMSIGATGALVSDRAPDAPPAPDEPSRIPDARGTGLPQVDDEVDELVAALAARADDLPRLAASAGLVVAALTARLDAGAAALLLPDAGDWCVVAATEPPAEGARVAAAEQLSGAPLAAWPHVLAVPVPQVDGVLVAARAEPFADGARAAAEGLAVESAALLASGVAVRALARALASYAAP